MIPSKGIAMGNYLFFLAEAIDALNRGLAKNLLIHEKANNLMTSFVCPSSSCQDQEVKCPCVLLSIMFGFIFKEQFYITTG